MEFARRTADPIVAGGDLAALASVSFVKSYCVSLIRDWPFSFGFVGFPELPTGR